MISKQRLEELIEQGATIYENKEGYISHIAFDNANIRLGYKVSGIYLTFGIQNATIIAEIKNLFETEEDARWELEMTATRTETLKIPTYEKVFEQDRCLDCYTKEFAITKTDIVIGICLFGVDFTNKVVEVSVGADKMFVGELTKENYISACKLCLKLFKGEEV